jgi:iron complex outermembrane receptor protein
MTGSFILLAATSGLALAATTPALAQTATPPAATPAPAAAPSDTQVEEIVVTAQRTRQRLQDVPIAVSAVTAKDAEVRGLNSIDTLTAAIPGLDVHIQGTAPAIFLRGVGTDQGAPNVEPSVALYIDGVYYPNAVSNVFTFNNIDRIEVLKGPQGTLFGRNATGGVIQILTKDPSQILGFHASLGYGNFDSFNGNFYVTGGLAKNISADLAVSYDNRAHGYGYDVVTRQDVGKARDFSARSKILFTPDEHTEIRLEGDYSYTRNDLVYQTPQGLIAEDGQIGWLGKYITRNNNPYFTTSKQYGGSLKIDRDLGFGRLVSISSYHKAEGLVVGDDDQTPLPLINYILNQPTSNYSQELQLLSPKQSKIQWAVGAFYFHDHAGFLPGTLSGTAFAPLTFFSYTGDQKVQSISVYGQATAPILPATNLTLGIRYTNDKAKFFGNLVSDPGVLIPTEHESFSSNKPTWRVALDHKFSPDILGYLSYNRGVKSGGYNLFVPATSFAPEQLDAYEAGLKTELFDRKLRLNLASFYYNYKNIQVTIDEEAALSVANAAAARIYGLDFDFQAKLFKNLSISGGGSYLNGKYKSYDNAVYYPPSVFDGVPANIAPLIAPGGKGATGFPTVYTPKWTGNVQADYLVPTSIGDFTLSGSLAYYDGANSTAYGEARLPRYTLVNSSLNWKITQNWGATLWVKNLTNAYYMNALIATGNGNQQLPALPRTFGGSVSVKF